MNVRDISRCRRRQLRATARVPALPLLRTRTDTPPRLFGALGSGRSEGRTPTSWEWGAVCTLCTSFGNAYINKCVPSFEEGRAERGRRRSQGHGSGAPPRTTAAQPAVRTLRQLPGGGESLSQAAGITHASAAGGPPETLSLSLSHLWADGRTRTRSATTAPCSVGIDCCSTILLVLQQFSVFFQVADTRGEPAAAQSPKGRKAPAAQSCATKV